MPLVILLTSQDTKPLEYKKLTQRGDKPSKRSGHTLTCLSDGTAVLFGGLSLQEPAGPNNELYTANISDCESGSAAFILDLVIHPCAVAR